MRSSTISVLLALGLGLTAASPVKRANGPTVTFQHGTVVGALNSGIDSFKGIPYAQPPTGDRRLRVPLSYSGNFGTVTATGVPTACPAVGNSASSTVPDPVASAIATALPGAADVLLQYGGPYGEDCLNLNVWRPSSAKSNSKLPVVAWIYGGGFYLGSTLQYDPTQIMQKAQQLNQPFIFVAMNYRVAAFGFLAGKELSADGSTNLGLRDQRLALQWIQDNIASFGGDPSKVTIWGESAGAFSVADHLTIESGNNLYNGKPLFSAAIMNSGFALPALEVTHPRAQSVFDTIVAKTGCSGVSDKLACLRTVDFNTLLNAQHDITGAPYFGVNFPYLPRPDPASSFFPVSPEVAFANGNFAKVPMIAGTQQDEGSFFATALLLNYTANHLDTDAGILQMLATIVPNTTPQQRQDLLSSYPTDPSSGCPYNTGVLNEVQPNFKRIAALIGDVEFVLARRIFLDAVSSLVKVWSYTATYDYGLLNLGTTHSTDILLMFYNISLGVTSVDDTRKRYISFITRGDPNALNSLFDPSWPAYNTNTRTLLSFDKIGTSTLTDNFRQSNYNIIKQNYQSYRT